jgi:hypothetical protein
MGKTSALWPPSIPNPGPNDFFGSLTINNIQWDPAHNDFAFSGSYFNALSGTRLADTVQVTGTVESTYFLSPTATIHFSGMVTKTVGGFNLEEDIDYQGSLTFGRVHYRTGSVAAPGHLLDCIHQAGTPCPSPNATMDAIGIFA